MATVVVLVGDGGADAGVDRGVADETFFMRDVQECAMVDAAGVVSGCDMGLIKLGDERVV